MFLFLNFIVSLFYGISNLSNLQSDINSLVDKTNNAVVSVRVVKEGEISVIEPEFFFFGIPEEKVYKFQFSGIGSGVIISEDGYVITNDHVIRGADEIKIEANENGKKVLYSAKYVGGQPKLDIAILKINSSGKKFNYLEFSTKSANVGDLVFAIGYPFGFKQTYTMGIVSAKDISLKIEGRVYDNLIQTDAAINQGNSGGPLVDINGKIVGINSAIYSKTGEFAGVGFAIPSWKVRQVVDEVIFGKKTSRGWLGISLVPTDYLASKYFSYYLPKGGIINKVYKDSPAEKAGLKRGDIVVSIDGGEVEDDEDLVLRIYYRNPGDKVEIKYVRDGKEYATTAVLGARPSDSELSNIEKSSISQKKALDEYEFKGIIFEYLGKSCVVKKVKKDSPLKGYLKEGDEIIKINNKGFDSYKKMIEVFSSINLSEGVLFDMIRNGEPMFLSVTIK
ncbi:MAG: trypsin-like peptidase domain-containing protein [Elusimicrobiales bacterium]|nr:trypsin-like peptidase domain-containing protein [Elusimicrobiales bacterium]